MSPATKGQARLIRELREELGQPPGDNPAWLTFDDAVSAIDALKSMKADVVPVSMQRVHPHAHLPAIGTELDPHRKIDERMFITEDSRRRTAYEISDPQSLRSYFSDCLGMYFVHEYIPDAPIVVARCDLCGEQFGYKVKP